MIFDTENYYECPVCAMKLYLCGDTTISDLKRMIGAVCCGTDYAHVIDHEISDIFDNNDIDLIQSWKNNFKKNYKEHYKNIFINESNPSHEKYILKYKTKDYKEALKQIQYHEPWEMILRD